MKQNFDNEIKLMHFSASESPEKFLRTWEKKNAPEQ